MIVENFINTLIIENSNITIIDFVKQSNKLLDNIEIGLTDGADVMMDSIIERNINMSDNGLGVVWFCLFAHVYSLINYTLGFECNSIDFDLIFSGW